MKTNILMTIAFLIFVLTAGYSQNTDKDIKAADKVEKKIELQKLIENLIDSKQFVFIANRALPMGGASIDLTTNSNYVKFNPDYIDSYMPFFGEAYSVDYNVDTGVKFEGKPEMFTIKRLKKNRGYDILTKVSLVRDTYDLRLEVGLEGNSTLTISSFNRSTISYNGQIVPPEKQKEESKDAKGDAKSL
jgi:hypothetical protein